MTIRRRTLLIMLGTGLLLLGVVLAAGRAVIMAGTERVEAEMARHDLARIRDALAGDAARLAATAGDWASWDEMYTFAADRNPAFVAENVSLAAFRNLDIDLVLLVDPAGEIVHLKAFDLERGEDAPETAAAFAAYHARNAGPLRPPDDRTAPRGVVVLPGGAFLAAAHSVLRSDGSGPARGTLVFARRLDPAAQARLAGLAPLETSTVRLDDPALPEVLRALLPGSGAREAVESIGPERIAAVALLPDLSGAAGLVIRTLHPRAVRAVADRTLRYFLLALLAAGVTLLSLGFVLLERKVLAPLSTLGAGVREIGRDRNLTRRLPVSGDDELAALAAEVNGMLEQIQASAEELRAARVELASRVREQEQAETTLRRNEELLRLVLESADELIFMQDLEGRCLYYNASRRLLNGEEDAGRTPYDLLDLGLGGELFGGIREVAATGRSQSGEVEVALAGGRTWFRRSCSPVVDAAGCVTAVVTIAHEVTAEKKLRERISRAKEEWERTFDAVGDLIMLVDDRSRIVRVNREMAERFGTTPQRLVGRACRELQFCGAARAAACPFDARAEGGGKPRTVEIFVAPLNGFYRLSVYPVRNDAGRITGAVHVATDLTERRKVEEELRRMNLMNQDILQRAPFGVFVVKGTGEVEYVNPAMVRISGTTEERFLSSNILAVDSYRKTGIAPLVRGAAAGKPFFLGPVEHVSHFSGKVTTRNFTGFPLDLGSEKKVLIFVEDLTELKRMEDALRTVTEEISALAGQAFFEEVALTLARVLRADAVFVGTTSGERPEEVRVIAPCVDGAIADGFLYRLAGTPCAGVLGRGVCRHLEGVRARFPGDPLLARLGAEGYLGIPLFASDGRACGLMAALWRRPLADAPFAESLLKVFAIRVAAEIERAQAEESLRRTTALLRTIVLASPLPIVAVDPGRAIRIWNPAAEALFGWSAEEATSLPAPSAGREHWGEFIDLLDGREHRGGAEPRLARRKDGSLVEVDIWSAPLEDPREEGTLRLVVFADRTETRRLQKQLLRAQRMEVIGKLAAGLAHEVRNPLNAIMAVSDALAQDLAASPEYQPFLFHIRTQVNRLATLMEELLSFGKPIARERFTELSLEALCREAVALWLSSHPAAATTVAITVDAGAEDLVLRGDRERLTQVLFNLVENAAQHSPEGSVVRVLVRGPADGRCGFEVRDRGAGIAPEAADRLFEPFFSTRKGGTGLGLSIVRSIVEAHGGSIRLRNNEPGPGCTAEVSLPCPGGEAA